MTTNRPNRRDFFVLAGTSGLVAAALPAAAKGRRTGALPDNITIAVPDQGWRLWIDETAPWQDDVLYLPEDVNLAALPMNPPTGGWAKLADGDGKTVELPGTVEQHYWGKFGSRSYTSKEYAWAHRDPVPQNGAYRGVSWWWRDIEIPAAFKGRRILLHIRGARMRAEVFLNEKLVGYSIMEELPFECDLTEAAAPGGQNRLAIRITNPGGRYDWIDGDTLQWGKVRLMSSHGFGGLDRGMSLSAHPMDGRIADLWVLNTPDLTTVNVFVKLDGAASAEHLALEVFDKKTGVRLPAVVRPAGSTETGVLKFTVTSKRAKRWSLSKPNLYRLRAVWKSPQGGDSRKTVAFGFRWFAPHGVGKDAQFRLNGRRIKLYSSISWGYWGPNGIWPSLELAEREVTQAKALGLNCLSFHRDVGKEDVFAAQDRMGLLRMMEPGGGKFALGRLPPGTKPDQHSVIMLPPVEEADKFCQRFMLAKCAAMVRAFRSHPSLIQYTLQNENNGDFNDPSFRKALDVMRAEDESRIILFTDGLVDPPTLEAQAWYAPYDAKLYRSDEVPWGAWWDMHQGAGDQWYDKFYQGPDRFTYRQPLKSVIVEFGEMEGCAVPDNHEAMVAEIMRLGGSSYDLEDHQQILAGTNKFLDRWGFRKAFPTAGSLFLAIGKKCYDSWQQYLENARINDATDCAVVSGWESTAIENHSGLVDNLRNLKSNAAIVHASLLPVRPVAKQRTMTVAVGDKAVFDLYLLNDTGLPAHGKLVFSLTNARGQKVHLGTFPVPAFQKEQFSALIKEGFTTPPLLYEGRYRFSLALTGSPHATHERDIWVTNTALEPVPGRTLRVGAVGVLPDLLQQLGKIPGIIVEHYNKENTYSVIVASGLNDQSTPAQKMGGDIGLTVARAVGSTPVPGALPPDVLAAVKTGTPLLVMAPENALADGVATQLAAEGAFSYSGQVGSYRAPWMGNWYFLRAHPIYEGLPMDQEMGLHFQAPGRQANGLIVDGPNVDVFVGYSRDHDRAVGAGTFTTKLGATKIVFQRVPDMVTPAQQRFLRNALAWLCG